MKPLDTSLVLINAKNNFQQGIEPKTILIIEWEQCEKFDLHLNGRYPTKPSSQYAAAPAFNGQYQHGRGDEKQASKAKKFLKPSKEGMKYECIIMWIDFQLWILPFSTGPP
jgi:hypothetical protein